MAEPMDISLPNLHDAVLERIEIVWETGIATIELRRVPGAAFVLTARGLLDFSMPRRQDWGPSVCVNSAHVQRNDEGEVLLTIEMQSGDTLSVIAKRLDTAPRYIELS
jgi:hypothetical protein